MIYVENANSKHPRFKRGRDKYGYMISAKDKSDTNPTSDRSANYSSSDFGLVGGIKCYFLKRFNVDVRYVHGVTNILNDTNIRDALGRTQGTVNFITKYGNLPCRTIYFNFLKLVPANHFSEY